MDSARQELTAPALLKIGRAKHHINDLNRRISAYLSSRPLRLVTLGEPESDRETHFIKEEVPLPLDFALIIGDAVHNLRSALDVLMFSMIGGKAKRPERVMFPFAKRADTLVSAMQNSEAQLAGEKVVAEIERLKPYPDGNKWLAALHALDIADKHKLIIPTTTTASMSAHELALMLPSIVGREGVNIVINKGTSFVSSSIGNRATRLANRRNIRPGEYERDIQPTFEIAFGEGQPMEGYPVIPVLLEMTNIVDTVVEHLATCFFE